jgi:SAM-dependent methyltransferase
MYGQGYLNGPDQEAGISDPKDRDRVVSWLARLSPGTFLDFGCGEGALLTEAMKLGWRAIGVEYDPGVAARVARQTGAMVVTSGNLEQVAGLADVVNVGDVIEHLTDLEDQMALILRLLRPGGLLLAQGPLEVNASLYTWTLRLARRWRAGSVEMAPYHVLQATAAGQRVFFKRFGLVESEYLVSEVDWPAPSRLDRALSGGRRALVLYCLRRASRMVSRLAPERLGNRYFYAGRRPS